MHIVIEMALLVTFSQYDWINDSVATPPFNISALIMHQSNLCFLLNSIPSLSLLFPSFWVYCRVISLCAIQQNQSQLYSHSSETGPLPIYCHPGCVPLPQGSHGKACPLLPGPGAPAGPGPFAKALVSFQVSLFLFFYPGTRANRGDFIYSSPKPFVQKEPFLGWMLFLPSLNNVEGFGSLLLSRPHC